MGLSVYKIFDEFGIERMREADNSEKSQIFNLMLVKQYGKVEEWRKMTSEKTITRIASLYD